MNAKNGEIYIACDGGQYGHLVLDCNIYGDRGDIVTLSFNNKGILREYRIDDFKLTRVRYQLCTDIPEWIPESVLNERKYICE